VPVRSRPSRHSRLLACLPEPSTRPPSNTKAIQVLHTHEYYVFKLFRVQSHKSKLTTCSYTTKLRYDVACAELLFSMHMLTTDDVFHVARDRRGRTTRRAQLEQAAPPMAPWTDEAVDHANAYTYIPASSFIYMLCMEEVKRR
jgi:hypothetical protein